MRSPSRHRIVDPLRPGKTSVAAFLACPRHIHMDRGQEGKRDVKLSYGIRAVAAGGLLAGAAIGVSACGVHRPPSPRMEAVVIHIAPSQSLAALCVRLGQNLGFFAQEGIRVVEGSSHRADIRILPAGSRWPIRGVISLGAEAAIVAPRRDPGFRLAGLNQVPVVYPGEYPTLTGIFEGVMALHDISHPWLVPLAESRILTLWKEGLLPYVLANSSLWYRLLRLRRSARVLAVLAASTGPIPTSVVNGRGPKLPPFLAALNLSLWYLRTHSPATIAKSVSSTGLPVTWEVATAQRYHWLAPASLPTRSTYERGRAFWMNAGIAWPAYRDGVRRHPSLIALTLTP